MLTTHVVYDFAGAPPVRVIECPDRY